MGFPGLHGQRGGAGGNLVSLHDQERWPGAFKSRLLGRLPYRPPAVLTIRFLFIVSLPATFTAMTAPGGLNNNSKGGATDGSSA